MDIDAKTVPVGQTVLLGETEHITTRFTRVSKRKGFVEYFEPVDGCTVLKIEVDVYGESTCNFQYIDRAYWTLTVNGRPMAPSEEAEGTINVNAETRTIEIITVVNDLFAKRWDLIVRKTSAALTRPSPTSPNCAVDRRRSRAARRCDKRAVAGG